MGIVSTFVIAYAVLLMLGGVVGYLQANSLVSLIAGFISGLIMLVVGFGIRRNSTLSYYLSFLFTFLIFLFFTFRFLRSYKMMPAGMMMVLSAIILLLLLFKFSSFRFRQK